MPVSDGIAARNALKASRPAGGCADAHNWKTACDMRSCASEQIGAGKRSLFFSDAAVLLRWHAEFPPLQAKQTCNKSYAYHSSPKFVCRF